MNEEEEPEFMMPDSLLEKIYELSGGSDKYKGIILCASSESGSPLIFSKFESTIVELALRKSLEQWLLRDENYKVEEDFNDL